MCSVTSRSIPIGSASDISRTTSGVARRRRRSRSSSAAAATATPASGHACDGSQPKEVATPSAVHATNATTSRGAGLIAWSPNANATSSSRRGRSYCRCGYATNSLPRRLHLGQQRVQHLVGTLAFDLQLRRQREWGSEEGRVGKEGG